MTLEKEETEFPTGKKKMERVDHLLPGGEGWNNESLIIMSSFEESKDHKSLELSSSGNYIP